MIPTVGTGNNRGPESAELLLGQLSVVFPLVKFPYPACRRVDTTGLHFTLRNDWHGWLWLVSGTLDIPHVSKLTVQTTVLVLSTGFPSGSGVWIHAPVIVVSENPGHGVSNEPPK